MKDNPWYQLRHGSADRALEWMAEAHRQTPDAANILQLGAALLLLEKYDAAWRHFQKATKTYPYGTVDAFHGGAGAALWCVGQRKEAVEEWRRGLASRNTDGARVRIPLLLYFASVAAPDACPDTDTRTILIKRADDAWAKNWAGPVAQFVVGRIDREALLAKCVGVNERDTACRRWYAEFYMRIRRYAMGDTECFAEAVRIACALTDDDFEPNSPHFRWKFGCNEFFISRHEARMLNCSEHDAI